MVRSLKVYQGQDIRNVALVGHAHCGKTTLISALLQAAKMTERLGRVDDGSAVTAYDRRGCSPADNHAECLGIR